MYVKQWALGGAQQILLHMIPEKSKKIKSYQMFVNVSQIFLYIARRAYICSRVDNI